MSTGAFEGDRQPIVDFIRSCLRDMSINGSVLEVGSLWVGRPGSTLSPRECFNDRTRFPSYIGIDMMRGAGVDEVITLKEFYSRAMKYNVILCAEMLEHDAHPWETVKMAYDLLVPGGAFIVTTRSIGFPRHDYPSDYYRFTKDGLRKLLETQPFVGVKTCEHTPSEGTFGLAKK